MHSPMDWPLVGLIFFGSIIFIRMMWVIARGLGSASANREVAWERMREATWEKVVEMCKQPSSDDILKYAPKIIRENLTGCCTAEELRVSGREDDIADSIARVSFFLLHLLETVSPRGQFSAECIMSVIEGSGDINTARLGFGVLLHETGFLEYNSDEDEYAFSSEFLAEVAFCVEGRSLATKEINPIDLKPEFFV